MVEILGWSFKRKPQKTTNKKIGSPFVAPQNDDAAFVIGTNAFGRAIHAFSAEQSFSTDNDLIRKYRDISLQPEVDLAVTDIVNEAIEGSNESAPVEINMEDLKYPESLKKKVREEFNIILKKLDFSNSAYETFRKWYVDGRIYYHVIIDLDNPTDGIQELRYVSPLNIKKIREEKKGIGPGGIEITEGYIEYYLYSKGLFSQKDNATGLKLSVDSVVFVNSGLVDEEKNTVFSYLHKAMKPANQLRMIEDAIIIYRLSRAPERRVFYVDVGNLPKNKAEEYLRGIMTKYKNKMVYDGITGEVKDSTNTMSMLEDLWMPRREGGKGTEVTTLDGGQNLGEIQDVEFFKKKLYSALGVPYSRIAPDAAHSFTIGRSSETTRDEIKFGKFISRLRKRFSHLFYELLKKQLLLKNIITNDDWEEFQENISFDFLSDSFFAELKEAEILRERVNTLRDISDYIGVYFSKEFVRTKVLQMTEEEIEDMKEQMDKEGKEEPDMIAKQNEFAAANPNAPESAFTNILPPPSQEDPDGSSTEGASESSKTDKEPVVKKPANVKNNKK